MDTSTALSLRGGDWCNFNATPFSLELCRVLIYA
jgi:hypothetical protein